MAGANPQEYEHRFRLGGVEQWIIEAAMMHAQGNAGDGPQDSTTERTKID